MLGQFLEQIELIISLPHRLAPDFEQLWTSDNLNSRGILKLKIRVEV